MNYQELRQKFQQQVHPSKPNDWDIEDVLDDLVDLEEEQQLILLRAIPAVWPISHSLSFSFLKEGARNGRNFTQQTIAEWLRRILSSYEEGGLVKARAYMAESDTTELTLGEDLIKAALEDNITRLTAYARGLSGMSVELHESAKIYTNTRIIFLPESIDYFPNKQANIQTYSLLIGLQASFMMLGSFGRHRFHRKMQSIEGAETLTQPSAESFFEQFDNVRLAKCIYQLLEIYRAMELLRREYPGLIRETANIRRKLWLTRQMQQEEASSQLEKLFQAAMLPEQEVDPKIAKIHNGLQGLPDIAAVNRAFYELYTHFAEQILESPHLSFLPFMDSFNYIEAEKERDLRIEKNKKKFETLLSEFLINKQLTSESDINGQEIDQQADSARIQPGENDGVILHKSPQPAIVIRNESIELPNDIAELLAQIISDQGSLPEGYVSAAFGLAGQGRSIAEGESLESISAIDTFLPYDEWDYRRQGYRKNWCSLRERTLKGVKSHFVQRSLDKHRRVIVKIRRQFEMLRTQERFARRRRFGNDVDLDALIDALGDRHAGLAPSEKLFIRLLRSERSISTYFLVDMSNSTEGWVGLAIKEALVILCEAMEVVGDSYAIYGFSGMRRMRSEIYTIKAIQEKYTPDVKERLAAISPKEYTRMGPPIRHMIQHMRKSDTKTKLLFILSDGKPEDYDDYKGQYAIEDTRKALAEARGHHIHTYCITIDKDAHDYLEYMFGRGNYSFVKDIQQLPSRLSEIYRLLTR